MRGEGKVSVLDYIDSKVFCPVYDGDIPLVESENIERICQELRYAITNGETIFVYGDYDMDGFCSVMVWKEVLSLLGARTPAVFQYVSRMHNLDKDILRQVKLTDARVVIICDTGSSAEDLKIINILQLEGYVPIVIDHHVCDGEYANVCKRHLFFNSYEEREHLYDCAVSGGYASLLVAKILSERYMGSALSFNAKVYALASMYADVVDMSSSVARALYNAVAVVKAPGPSLFVVLNKWDYLYSRRFFSFIVAPKINGCFRMERLGILNNAMTATERFKFKEICTDLNAIHQEASSMIKLLVPEFKIERIADIVLCTHILNENTQKLHVRNFTGVIANRISSEEKTATVVVVKVDSVYHGSFRDFYSRPMKDTFSLFCEVGGHPAAFGIRFSDLDEFKRSLVFISKKLTRDYRRQFVTLSSSVISTSEDYDALALYNEYMNAQPKVVVSHKCEDVHIVRSTKYNKYYQVGLPAGAQVTTRRSLTDGMQVLLEPALCSKVELREIE